MYLMLNIYLQFTFTDVVSAEDGNIWKLLINLFQYYIQYYKNTILYFKLIILIMILFYK